MTKVIEGRPVENPIPPFLARLGLDETADERAVRRAYARLLKQTDQEADAEGFQLLREAYEHALHWLAWRHQQSAESVKVESATPAEVIPANQEPEGSSPSCTSGSEPQASSVSGAVPVPARRDVRAVAANESEQVARGVLQELHDMLSRGWTKNQDGVRAWLRRTLEDERLIDMDARFLFESGVVVTLANGWQPGKEHLFGPAVECFGWQDDRGRLGAFHRPGSVVSAAIGELEFFESLPLSVRMIQRELIHRLRENKRPGTSFLLRQMPLLNHLSQVYPHWLHLNTNTQNIERWRQWAAEVPKWRLGLFRVFHRASAPGRAKKSAPRFGWLFFWLVVLSGIGRILGSWTPHPASPPSASQGATGTRIPGEYTRHLPLNTEAPATARVAVAPVYLVAPQVAYPSIAKRMGLQGRVVVEVIIDADGQIRQAQVQTSSGHTVLDEAAMTAVLNARFMAAKDATGKPVASSYKIPINFQLTHHDDARRLPQTYGDAIQDTVRPYIVFTDLVNGNPVAEVSLRLTQDGQIQDFKLSKSSGNKAWDAAVLRAIEHVPRFPADQNGQVPPEMVIAFRPKV